MIYSYYRESCRSLVASQQSYCLYLNAPPTGMIHTEQCGTILLKQLWISRLTCDRDYCYLFSVSLCACLLAAESMEFSLDADSPINSPVRPCTPDFYLARFQQVQPLCITSQLSRSAEVFNLLQFTGLFPQKFILFSLNYIHLLSDCLHMSLLCFFSCHFHL